MQVAMVGLGKMGMNMAKRLLREGHEVIAFNRTKKRIDEFVEAGGVGAYSLKSVVEKMSSPRVIWFMLPAGKIVDDHIRSIVPFLSGGDIIVDGGNTDFHDDIQRALLLGEKKVQYLDVGVSGGIWGLEKGYCLMVGGEKNTYEHVEPLLKALAAVNGYLYCGDVGSGHFVKMVHNGIEYGMLQAIGEGFQILESSSYSQQLDFEAVARLWNHGSVVRCWLLELAESIFKEDNRLSDIQGYVDDSGEARWVVRQALETGVSAPVITLSLMQRFRSREADSFSDKIVAALRRAFGGHGIVTTQKGKDI